MNDPRSDAPASGPAALRAPAQEILDRAETSVFVKDLEGRYLFVNRAFERLRGQPASSIVGRLDADVAPDKAAHWRAQDRKVVEARQAMDFEDTVETGRGSRTFISHRFPLLDAKGEPFAVGCIATDITERRCSEDALRAAALAVSGAEGDQVFPELCRHLADILDVDAAFIAVFADAGRAQMRTLACRLDGRFLRDFEYPLAGSPCAAVVGREFRFVPRGVLPEFPPDTLFRVKGMDSYAAMPLNDVDGRPLGLIAVLDREPMADPSLAESILKIFAARAAAEIERRRAAEALAASEAQYRAIFNASEDALMLWNSRLVRVDVNPAHETIFGFAREDVVGRAFEGLPYPESFVRPRLEMIRRALAGEASHAELEAMRKDGRRIVTELRAIPFVHHGEPHVLQIARDVTARRQAEEALRASEEQHRAIFNASEDALVLWDPQFRRVDVNAAYERLYGWSRDEVVGRGYEHPAFTPEYARPRLELVRRALDGEACHAELEAIRKDGRPVPTEIRAIPFEHRGRPHVLTIARDITERKRAEQALRASEEQYRAIFNASEDALVLWDSQCRRVDVNPAYERIYGYSREEVLADPQVRDAPAGMEARRHEIVRRTLDGERCHVELDSVRRDGTPLRIEVRTIPVRHRDEPHVLAIVRDVTERRRAEAALRASEQRYRLLFEMESDAILVTDAETLDVLDANRAAVELWGYPRDELLGLKATDVSDEPEASRAALQGPAGSVVVPLRWHRRKDGTRFPVEITLSRFDLDGRRIVLSAIRDITERREREEALARGEARLRATVEAAFDCVVGMDSAGRVIEFNPAAERTFGYRRDEVLGRPLAELIIPPADRDGHDRGIARFVGRGAAPWVGRRVEATAMRAGGESFPVELAIAAARAGDQDIFVGYLRDLTERKAEEARRAELEAQLRQSQKMEALGKLTGGVAHDFNNLLASIMGYVALASEHPGVAGDANLARYMDQAWRSCERARDLIQQMLAFSRSRPRAPRTVSLPSLVAESMGLLRASIPASIEIRTVLEPGVPPVLLDPVQLDQVLMNLAINARDAMPGGGTLTVSVARAGAGAIACGSCRASVDGTFVELVVADTGAGIAPEVQERMFEPFFTTKEVGRGTGMGLSTVHGIVHEHGGHVVVESTPGAGARFRVLLPALAEEGGTAGESGEGPRASLRPLAGRVLVVDDEPAVASYMRDLLASWDLDVDTVGAPSDALARIAAEGANVDVLITDHTMPGMSGLELARAVALLQPSLPVLLYTGHADALPGPAYALPQIRATLAKPVAPHALHAALAEALAARARD